MKRNLHLTYRYISIFFFLFLAGSVSSQIWINEIHYDNAGGDVAETVEVAGPAGIMLSDYQIVLYNGANGTSYNTTNLGGVIDNEGGTGFGAFAFGISGIQNGAPDGIALVQISTGTVLEFLSYEGSFMATNGPANGMTSVDIGVSETSATPAGQSLQLIGSGSMASDFTWAAPMAQTSGSVNGGQTFVAAPAGGVVFINEFHYDNAGGDVGEFIEIAGTAGLDLTGYQLVLYNGNGGATYNTTNLAGIIDDEGCSGFGALHFLIPGIQNGAPDGIALVDPLGNVVEFISYEGSFMATNGPASGMTSVDVGVLETGGTAIGQSLQLTGVGNVVSDFTWNGPSTASPGTINAGQTFTGGVAVGCGICSITVTPIAGCLMGANFEANVTVNFVNPPATGTLDLTGDGTGSVAVGSLSGGMHTFMNVTMPADGMPIGVTAAFSADAACMLNEMNAGTAPDAANFTSTCTEEVIFINEIHYDNGGGDIGEFIEIAGTAGICLDNYELVLYNGNGGSVYNTMSLSGNIPNEGGSGFGAIAKQYLPNGIQNGSPDGIALVNNGCVLEFISYEGVMTANNGPAAGLCSVDIGVQEAGGTNIGESVQLSGSGSMAGDFAWNAPAAESPGMLNAGQTITCPTTCAISGITLSKISSCINTGAGSTFTANVTVNFAVPPTTGTLDLTGDATGSVSASNICGNQHTFIGVTMTADGGSIDISSAFSDAACSFAGIGLGTAPFACCPIDAICQDAAIVLPPSGELVLNGTDFDGGTVTCNPTDFTVMPAMVGCADLGDLTITLTITDQNTGNTDNCTANLALSATDGEPMGCNDLTHVSIDGDECSLVNFEQILEGDDPGCYSLSRNPALNGDCGDAPFGDIWVNCADVGQTITVKVTNLVTGNYCWGSVLVEDKWAPTINCDGPFVIDCTQDPASLPLPIVTDNCEDLTPFVVTQEEVGADCGVKTLTITYQAADKHGNLSDHCERVITINPTSAINFPADIEWECGQYGSYPNITDATPVNSLIDIPNACLETNRNNRLRFTGSGVPNVMGLNNSVCKYTVTHQDQVLQACGGVSTDLLFKTIRTWTVLNWCTGAITQSIQLIKVSDKSAPEIFISNNEIPVNTTVGGSHATCASSGLIPAPMLSDDCSGIKEVRVFTPGGEALPVMSGGSVVGYEITAPYLEEGTHDITFRVSDNCGNMTEEVIPFNVVDVSPPVPVCRELTQVSLNSFDEGLSKVLADHFNEASYDDCGPVYFKVRKMELGTCDDANINRPEELDYVRGIFCNINDPQEWYDEDVVFCCEEVGTTVNVILRVYDRNPVCNGWSSVPTLEDVAGTHFDPPCYPVCDLGGVTTAGLSQSNRYYNDCMIEVLVEDKSRPDCVAPDDVWTDCSKVPENIDWDDSDALDDLFGAGRAIDNCSADLTSTARVNLDLCGVGNVTRTFRARDAYGNVGVNVCRQTIMIQQINDYCITLPADFEDECTNNNSPSDLSYVETGCDLLAISVEENELLAGSSGDECKKIVRTWSIINWCEYDGVSSATVMARADFIPPNSALNILGDDREFCSDGTTLKYTHPTRGFMITYPSTGYYTYDQHVKIFDNTAPEVSYDGPTKFCGGDLDSDPCNGLVDISIDVDDACTNNVSTSSIITASTDPSVIGVMGGGSIFTRFPLGTHTVMFTITDDCGNTSFLEVEFTVVDCKAPTPVCHNGLSIDVMPLSGMVEIWASDFDASSFDYCSDFILRANVVEDQNGDGLITSDDYQRTLPADDFVIVDCDDVGRPTMIQLWVSEQDGTADDRCADNQDDDFCVTFVEVQDNNGVCSGSKVAINGKVATEESETVENVMVEVNDGATMTSTITTDASGTYEFNLPLGGDYTVTPMKNDDVFNGVSTFDLLLVSKHILNVSLLNSPYKVLAADANRSGSVSTLDLVAIRKVVLREASSFPNNTSWRFVSKSQIFQNANNPWTSAIQEVENFNNLTFNQLNLDFVAIKVGDVNGDAQANSILGVDGRSFNGNFELKAAEQNFEAGEEVAMTLSSSELNSINGYQFTIQFNTKALSLKDIEHGVTSKENFGLSQADNGYITVSWDGEADSEEAFTLVFEAKAGSTLSEEVAISSALTVAEAYIGTDYRNVSLNFGQSASATTALYQNTPNPFKGETVIGFNMAEAATATMTISDVSGKVLKVVKGDYTKGYNTITVSSDELSTGVMYYQLDTDNFSQTLKMVVIK